MLPAEDAPHRSVDVKAATTTLLPATIIKNRVVPSLQRAKQPPQVASQEVAVILEMFTDGRDAKSAGAHSDTVEKLRAGTDELKTMLSQSKSRQEVNKKIDELLALANKLPGEVTVIEKPVPRQE